MSSVVERDLYTKLKKDAEKFEEKIKDSIIDPLKRAEERRDFYFKQRELLEELKLTQLEMEKREKTKFDIKYRKFEAFGDQTYQGTLITPIFEAEELKMKKAKTNNEKKRVAVFMDADGRLYDIDYLPIRPDDELLEMERGRLISLMGHKIESEMDEYSYIHDPDIFKNPPDPESFDTFEEYENSLKMWSSKCEISLGFVQLPKILGRHFYRPYVATLGDSTKRVETTRDGELKNDEVETWESLLIPQEPHPEFYETFEQYESAMIRWSICVLKSPFLPPHPVQLNKLLGIHVIMKPEGYKIPDVEYTGIPERKETKMIMRSKDVVLPTGFANNEWEKIDDVEKAKITEGFIDLLDKKKMSRETFGAYHRFMAPKIHGTFKPVLNPKDPKSSNFMRRLSLSQFQTNTGNMKTDISSVKEWIISQRADRSLSSVFSKNTLPYYHAVSEDLFHQFPLFREDLSIEEIKGSRDCEEIEQGEKVSFDIPDFEIGQVDFVKLKSADYARFLQIVLTRIDFGSRYSNLNSWYSPKVPKSYHVETVASLCGLFDSIEHPSQISGAVVMKVFQMDSYIDIFVNWLSSPLPKKMNMLFRDVKEEISNYKTLLYACTTVPDTLKQILSLFTHSNSKMIHAKVAFFILHFLKHRFSELVVEQLIKEKDIANLRILTVAASFFDEVPMNVFLIDIPMLESVIRVISNSDNRMKTPYEAFMGDLLTLYYLDSLGVSLLEGEQGYPQVYPLILGKMEILIVIIENFIENNQDLLARDVWRCVGYKVSEVSACGVFILSFLMTLAYRPKIYKKINTAGDLVTNLRSLALKKFTHVQDVVARIFPELRKPKWRPLLVDAYQNSDSIMEDLFTNAQRTGIDLQPPLISFITLDFLIHTLKLKKNTHPETKTIVNGLIQSMAFSRMLSEIVLHVEQKKLHQGLTIGAKFLGVFVKYLLCHNLIEIKDDKQGSTGTGGKAGTWGFGKKKDTTVTNNSTQVKLEVYVHDIVSLLDLVVTPFEKTINKKTYRFRSEVMDCLRHVLKIPAAFSKLKIKEKLLFQKILTICKDGSDMAFNRNAWRLFYQTFKFQVGTVDALKVTMDVSSAVTTGKVVKQRPLLDSFWELIYPENEDKMAWNILTTHSIHYFSKIISLPHRHEKYIDPYASDSDDEKDRFAKKTQVGGNLPTDDVIKSYTKSTEGLIIYVTSKDAYKVLEVAYNQLSSSYSGWPFQALALMFWYISKCPTSKKLVDVLRKGKERDSLDKIASMFNGPDD